MIVGDPDLRIVADDIMKDVITLANAHLEYIATERFEQLSQSNKLSSVLNDSFH